MASLFSVASFDIVSTAKTVLLNVVKTNKMH